MADPRVCPECYPHSAHLPEPCKGCNCGYPRHQLAATGLRGPIIGFCVVCGVNGVNKDDLCLGPTGPLKAGTTFVAPLSNPNHRLICSIWYVLDLYEQRIVGSFEGKGDSYPVEASDYATRRSNREGHKHVLVRGVRLFQRETDKEATKDG